MGNPKFVGAEEAISAIKPGIADLWGKTLSQRMDALVSIAHPDFRDDLSKASKL